MTLRLFLFICFIITPISAIAENFTWIIGGGPTKENSQIQIERNVKWASEVIKNKSENSILKVFYSDGDDPTPDIRTFVDRDSANNDKNLFGMVFGSTEFHPSKYVNHTVLNHSGSTRPDNLIPTLKQDFSELKENDSALILYNGHGWGSDSGDYGLNTLRLWTEQGLTVYDFEKLLNNINAKTPTRFILTQCYSGGFSRAIHPDATDGTMDLKNNRCGFMAESATREAEGCSASLKIGEYRDYTTYMFAAFNGKTRLGDDLAYDPDINQDKRISFREAHLYSLTNAYSNDLSRSTSEYYLEKWEPWYIRWLPGDRRSEDSTFHSIMTKVLQDNHLTEDAIKSSSLRDEGIKRLNRLKSLNKDLKLLKKKIKSTQSTIIKQLEQQYPEIKKHYKNKFEGYSTQSMSDIRTRVIKSAQLSALKLYFKNKDKLDLVLLDSERSLTQIEKIVRLNKLSKIDSTFPVFANPNVRDNFDHILSCEQGFL